MESAVGAARSTPHNTLYTHICHERERGGWGWKQLGWVGPHARREPDASHQSAVRACACILVCAHPSTRTCAHPNRNIWGCRNGVGQGPDSCVSPRTVGILVLARLCVCVCVCARARVCVCTRPCDLRTPISEGILISICTLLISVLACARLFASEHVCMSR